MIDKGYSIDKKIYKTDYESDFATYYDHIEVGDEAESEDIKLEVETYSKIEDWRDHVCEHETRNKLWENF